MQIAIDGPAGAGKSTVAKRLAKELNILYIDTGAMYRALTWKALKEKIDLDREDALAILAKNTEISFQEDGHRQKILCDGRDVTDAIRTPEVTVAVPQVAKHPKVRRILVERQQKMALECNVLMDGRDIGEKVLPNADFKFYITATPEERAKRRVKEWEQKKQTVCFDQVLQEIIERDIQDASRSEGALKKFPDAIEIDTTNRSVEEVVQEMQRIIGGC